MPLVGPSYKYPFPLPPAPEEGIQGIHRYLQQLAPSLTLYAGQVMANTYGLIGTTGLSGTGIAARNLRGNVTIEGTATAALVTFVNPEADASYFLYTLARTGHGSPMNYVTTVRRQSAEDFTVVISGAPGPGNGIIVFWEVLR